MLKELKQYLIQDNFEVEEPIEDVLVVKNYLTKDELDWFYNFIKNTPEQDWFIEYMSNLKPFCLEKFGRDDVENLVAEGLFEITQGWEDKNLNFSKEKIAEEITVRLNKYVTKIDDTISCNGFGSIQRMQEGVELKAHTDQDTDPSIKYATIIYLNDDYVDGELFFENKNLKIRPEPGSLLIFPGNKEFHHGVKHVGKGPIRYVLVAFIRLIKFYEHDREGNKLYVR